MKVVHSLSEFKVAIKAGEKDILIKGCEKKLLVIFSAAAVCKTRMITTAAGVVASAGIIKVAAIPITVGIGTVSIITSAATIVAIVALCHGYDIHVNWNTKDVHVERK